MELSVAVITGYMSDYLLTFIFCFIGAFIKEIEKGLKKRSKLAFSSIIIGSVFSTFVSCAIVSFIDFGTISVYALVCVLMGMFGSYMIDCISNKNNENSSFLVKFVINLLKISSNVIMKAFGETLDDERKEREKEANKAAKKKNKKDKTSETESTTEETEDKTEQG